MITFSILVIILERVSYLMQCWRPCPQSTGRQRLPLCNQLGTSSSHHHHHITIIIIVIIVIIIIMPLHWHDPRRKGQRWRSIGKSSRFIKQVALWIWKEDFNFPKLWILPYCQSLGVKHPTVWKKTNKSERNQRIKRQTTNLVYSNYICWNGVREYFTKSMLHLL